MKVLEPNPVQGDCYIIKSNVYVLIMDYGQIRFLKEIRIAPGQRTWYWIKLEENTCIDISNMNGKSCSFDYAINRAVNDPYCTVYEFDSYAEMIKNWNKIKYRSTIKTTYKQEE